MLHGGNTRSHLESTRSLYAKPKRKGSGFFLLLRFLPFRQNGLEVLTFPAHSERTPVRRTSISGYRAGATAELSCGPESVRSATPAASAAEGPAKAYRQESPSSWLGSSGCSLANDASSPHPASMSTMADSPGSPSSSSRSAKSSGFSGR